MLSRETTQKLFLQTLEGNEQLRREWNLLVLQMKCPQVFLTYEWALAVERSFGSSILPRIFISRREGLLAGIVALACKASDPGEMFFLTAATADYCDVISLPADRAFVIADLMDALRRAGVRKIFLASIPDESSTWLALQKTKNYGYWTFKRQAYECSRILLEQIDSGPGIFAKKNTKEKLRRLSRLGPLTVIHLQNPAAAAAALDSIVAAQVSRFLATQRLSPLLHLERRRFLLELTSLLGDSNWLDISVLQIPGRPIAWNFGFRFQGVLFWYLPTFDFSNETLSPGLCLLYLLIEESRNDKQLREIDLGLGDEAYKKQVANESRQTWNVRFSSSLAAHCGQILRGWLARTIAKSSVLETFARATMRRMAALIRLVRQREFSSLFSAMLRWGRRKVYSRDEIVFFEWNIGPYAGCNPVNLVEMDWRILARAALDNSEDSETLVYLQRAANRLKNARGKIKGFALLSSAGAILHLCWAADFTAFKLEEIGYELPALDHAQMLFDCWTPRVHRGSRHYASAVEQLAEKLRGEGKTAWIFSAVQNRASLKALKRSGFHPRYVLSRTRAIFRMPVEKVALGDS